MSDPPSRARRFGRNLFSSSVKETKTPQDVQDQKKLKRQSSLFDLFSKPKVEKARGFHDPAPVPSKTKQALENQVQDQASTEVFTRKKRESRLDLNNLIQDAQSSNHSTDSSTKPAISISQPPLSSTPNPPIQAHRHGEIWDPVPLFQAYPQSVIHGKLQGVSTSIESLTRARHSKPPTSFVGEMDSAGSGKSRRLSIMPENVDVHDKVFVLVTAGRLVQYAGNGNSDRMPEKILQLGPKSAAFACDLIPGKHWVVQVVQTSTDFTMPSVKPSRSILSRMRVPMMGRKIVTSLLLVFKSAENMEAWLKALRALIQELGGDVPNPADPETKVEREKEEVALKRLSSMPSHRYLVKKDSQKFPDYRRDSVSPVAPNPPVELPVSDKRLSLAPSATSAASGESPIGTPVERQSSSAFKSKRMSSAPTSTAQSPNLLHLEPLKETSRFSSTSTRTSRASDGDTGTAPTSICSSIPPSPNNGSNFEGHSPQTGSIQSFNNSPNLHVTSKHKSLPPMPPGTQGSVKRLSVVSAHPVIDRTSPTKQAFPPFDSNFQNPSSTYLQTPTIPEADSERSSAEYPVRGIRPAVDKVNSAPQPPSGMGQRPNLSRPQSRTEYNSVSPRVKPFARPLPIRAATSRDSKARLSIDTSTRDGKENQERLRSKQTQRSKVEEPLSPIKHLEKLASELQMDSAMQEARARELLNSGLQLNHRMSLQNLPTSSQNQNTRNRYSYAAPGGASMVPGRRTSSTGISTTSIPERRSSIVSISQGGTTLLRPMHEMQTPQQPQQQSSRLRRPNSMLIRPNNASFLSNRPGRTNSESRQTPPNTTELPSGVIPLMAASQGAAPAPFIPYSKSSAVESTTATAAPRTTIVGKEPHRFSIRSSTPVTQIAPMRAVTSNTRSRQLPDYLVTPAKIAQPSANYEREQTKRLSRATSPAFPNAPVLRPSYSTTDIASIAQRSGPFPANTSAKRLSFVAPQAYDPNQVKPRNRSPPPKQSIVARHSAMFNQQGRPSPVPIMALNRAALRGKHSMPNMSAVGLPPPLPPPNCPLPRVPSELGMSRLVANGHA